MPGVQFAEHEKMRDVVACSKKHAKKGRAWAQVDLAMRYSTNDESKGTSAEALHWFREAASRGHPMGMYFLGKAFLYGSVGCSVDLLRAQEYFDAALRANRGYSIEVDEGCWKGLIEIAKHHIRAKSFERAESILQPIAEEGIGEALTVLGSVFKLSGDNHSALAWFTSAAFAPYLGDISRDIRDHEHGAMVCCWELQKYAQAKFWGKLTRTTLQNGVLLSPSVPQFVRSARVKYLVQLQRDLRAIRDVCGGCGVEFEGKERKFCRGCRAYCYCSRDCQKMHWNRKDGGHREDCKGAMELKKKIKEKKRAEAMKASESK